MLFILDLLSLLMCKFLNQLYLEYSNIYTNVHIVTQTSKYLERNDTIQHLKKYQG